MYPQCSLPFEVNCNLSSFLVVVSEFKWEFKYSFGIGGLSSFMKHSVLQDPDYYRAIMRTMLAKIDGFQEHMVNPKKAPQLERFHTHRKLVIGPGVAYV